VHAGFVERLNALEVLTGKLERRDLATCEETAELDE
jgi:hypothetical protein